MINLDFRLLFQSLVMVFLAEIGDKTQLTIIALASEKHTFWAIFIGSAAGLILNTVLSMLFTDYLRKYISALHTSKIAAIIFIGVGIYMLLKKS